MTQRATAPLQTMWDGLDSYDESTIATLTVKSNPILAAVKASSVASAVGYYATVATVRPPTITPRELGTVANLRDPFIAYWQALASGRPWEEAVAAGRSRIEALVANFANSTARQTGDLFVAKTGLRIEGWERIPEPGACAWCEDVAQSLYPTAEAADFGHDRCGCTASLVFS